MLALLLLLSPLAGHSLTGGAYHAMEKPVLETLEAPRLSVTRVEKELSDSHYVTHVFVGVESLSDKSSDGRIGDTQRESFESIAEAQALLLLPVDEHTYLPRDYEVTSDQFYEALHVAEGIAPQVP